MLILVLVAPLPIQFPAHGLGKAVEDGPSVWVIVTPAGEDFGFGSSRHESELTVVGSLSFLFPFCNSDC